jgi:lipase ATG15
VLGIDIARPLKAMESRCHTGETILYDTVGKKNWAVDLRAHRIGEIINRVLDEDWDDPPEDEPVEIDPPPLAKYFENILGIALGDNVWGWPGRGLPARRKEPETDKEGKKKKKNPNAVPRPQSEEECVDCFRW